MIYFYKLVITFYNNYYNKITTFFSIINYSLLIIKYIFLFLIKINSKLNIINLLIIIKKKVKL